MTTITALPTPPARTQPAATFSTNADAFLAALPTFATQANAVASEVSANTSTATTGAATATTQAANAAASAAAAAASAAAALWVSGTTYAIGARAISPTTYQTYTRKTAGAGTTDPASDGTNWQATALVGECPIGGLMAFDSSQSANTITGAMNSTFLKTGVIADASTYPNAPAAAYGATTSFTNGATQIGPNGLTNFVASNCQQLASNGTREVYIFGNTGASYSGAYATDPVGGTWTPFRLPGSVNGTAHTIAYANGYFVVSCYAYAYCYTSPDGITWTQRAVSGSANWCSVAYGNGVWVMAATGTQVCYAADPTGTWTAATSTVAGAGMGCLSYGVGTSGAMFVIIGASAASSSPTGATWTARTMLAFDTTFINVMFANGLFVANVADSVDVNSLRTSPDGITWTARNSGMGGASHYPVFYIAGKWRHGSYYSTNGTAWSSGYPYTPSTAGNLGTLGGKFYILGAMYLSLDGYYWGAINLGGWLVAQMAYGNGHFFAGSRTLSALRASTDGLIWFTWATPTGYTGYSDGVAYFNGLYCVTCSGTTNNVATSPDGITWTNHTATNAKLLIQANTLLFGMTMDTAQTSICYSSNGTSWTNSGTLPSSNWAGVVYANSTYVLWNNINGNTYTSPDGSTWTAAGTIPTGTILQIVVVGSTLVLQSSTGALYTSTNGAVWALVTQVNLYRDLGTYAGNQPTLFTIGSTLFACADAATDLYVTSDGVNWYNRISTAPKAQASPTYRSFVIAGGSYYCINATVACKFTPTANKVLNDVLLKTYHATANQQTNFYKRVA